MYRNIKSIKRGQIKSARWIGKFNMQTKARRSPYFSPESIADEYVDGKIAQKSSKESRAIGEIVRDERRVMRCKSKVLLRNIEKAAHRYDEVYDDYGVDYADNIAFPDIRPVMKW